MIFLSSSSTSFSHPVFSFLVSQPSCTHLHPCEHHSEDLFLIHPFPCKFHHFLSEQSKILLCIYVTSSLFMRPLTDNRAEQDSNVHMDNISIIHLSTGRDQGWFHFLVTVKNATVNMDVREYKLSRDVPSSGVCSIFIFLRNLYTDFHHCCIIYILPAVGKESSFPTSISYFFYWHIIQKCHMQPWINLVCC